MARPRIFVSSTYYDLKHLRASIETFIESLGYESILSEKGDIAYSPDIPLDESCYREVRNTDVFVLVVGGRYGSEKSAGKDRPFPPGFFERYDSVTKLEYRAAVDQDIPIYIFIERTVYAEYQTFLRNKDKTDINYAHVDSVNIFLLIEEILGQPRNNPVREFDRYQDIESWLRDQWAGLFKDMLQTASSQKQLASLQQQVSNLGAIGSTLQRYLEVVVEKVFPQKASALIGREQGLLEKARQESELRHNPLVRFLEHRFELSMDEVVAALRESTNFDELVDRLGASISPSDINRLREVILLKRYAQTDANEARKTLGLEALPITASEESDLRFTESESQSPKRTGAVTHLEPAPAADPTKRTPAKKRSAPAKKRTAPAKRGR